MSALDIPGEAEPGSTERPASEQTQAAPSVLDEPRLRRLIEAGRVLVSGLDHEATLERLLAFGREVTGARYAAVGVLDVRRPGPELFITLGIDPETRERIDELQQGRGVLEPPTQSFLRVPIKIGVQIFGNLYLTEKECGAPFDAADEESALVLAAWTAIAVGSHSVAEDRLRQSIDSAERERGRWSRELHDETLQGLGAVRLLLASALRRGPDSLEGPVSEGIAQIGDEITKLRRLITDLRPAALDELGLQPALEALAQRHSSSDGTNVQTVIALAHQLGTAGERLDPDLESAIYRVAQEALSNVAHHAHAESVTLTVVEGEGEVELTVEDDGVGFDPSAVHEGFGLKGIRERAVLAGGLIEIRSAPEEGTTILARFPVVRREPPADNGGS